MGHKHLGSLRILVGGSPSTGSSLFRRILNRHPEVFCGPETNLFCHRSLFTDWSYYKRYLLADSNKKLRSEFWSMYYGPSLLKESYKWDKTSLESAIMDSHRFIDFCDLFFNHAKGPDVPHWAEKSPGNVFNFDLFLDQFKPCLILHTVRHPLDTIASLIKRGMNVYHALGVILMHNAFAMRSGKSSRYMMVKYEDLVRTPVITLERVCRHLSLDFSEDLLVPVPEERVEATRMQGWSFDETDEIQQGSIGRYRKLDERELQYIIRAMNSVRIKEDYATLHNLPYHTFAELATLSGYMDLLEMLQTSRRVSAYGLIASQLRNRFSRWRRGFEPWFRDNHPITLQTGV